MAPLGAIHALTHPTRRPAAKTRAWIEFLAEHCPAWLPMVIRIFQYFRISRKTQVVANRTTLAT
jgi:hypothetical protein